MNFIKKLTICLSLMTLTLFLNTPATLAANPCLDAASGGTNPLCKLVEIGEGSGLEGYFATGQHPNAPDDFVTAGAGTLTSPFYYAVDFIRFLVSGIAMLVIIVLSIRLISAATEEEAQKIKNNIYMGILGLILIQIADVFVNVFFGPRGEALEDLATAELYAEEFNAQVRGIVGLVEIFIGIIAVLVLVVRGYTVLFSMGDEEQLTKAKRHVIYASIGLGIVLISEIVVRGVIFPDAGAQLPDVNTGRFIALQIVNFLLGFASLFAFVVLFYGGYRYVVSGGDEEVNTQVKKLVLGAVIGLVVIFGAFAAVNTLLSVETGGNIVAPNENPDEPAS